MKNLSDGKANTSGVVVKGERYALWLRARPEDLKNPVEKRYVYLFSLDSFGRGTLLFPRVDSGNVENRIPPGAPDKDGYPVEIPLNRTITVGPPYGTDTSIVLTSDEALPPDLFDFEGVRTRGGPTGPAASPLTRLLSSVGAVTRGMAVAAPATWSVHRYPVLSVESASPAPGRSGGARSGNEAGSP
ncbi:MAG: hypothetical protein HY815_21930 [Candidatus Riflebacteria bacterium]|nr:hypothetical protein [Candidatus Riflebacteria bacterium]